MKKKLSYEDIKLNGTVKIPGSKQKGKVSCICNVALLEGINDPIFTVSNGKDVVYLGLKYVLKHYED